MSAGQLLLPDGRVYTAKAAGLGIGTGGAATGTESTSSAIIGSGASVMDLDVYAMLVEKHPTCNSCITLTANAIAADGWDIAPHGAEDAKPISADADPRVAQISTFMQIASPVVTDRGRRFAIAADLRTFGFSVLWKKRAGKALAALERIDPRTVTVRPNAAGTAVDKYVVRKRQPNGMFSNTDALLIDPNDIIFFSATGGDPLTGFSSPLEALDLTLATDFAQRRFREAFCRLGAKAGMVLTSDTYDEQAFLAAEAQIMKSRSGADNAYKTLLLPGGWKMVKAPNAGQDDADFVKATGLNKEDVAGVYAVPLGMLVFAAGALGSAGKGDDRDFFEQFACLPIEELIYERLTMSLLRDEFDIDDLQMVPKRRNRVRFDRFDAAVMLVKFGGTGNEARRLVNLPPISDTRYDMDAPLFLGTAFTGGIAEQEPLHQSDDTGLAGAGGAGSALTAVDAAQTQREDAGVTQKGARRFRGGRQGY